MTKPLRIEAEAEEEIAQAQDWYEQQRVGLGAEFVETETHVRIISVMHDVAALLTGVDAYKAKRPRVSAEPLASVSFRC